MNQTPPPAKVKKLDQLALLIRLLSKRVGKLKNLYAQAVKALSDLTNSSKPKLTVRKSAEYA
jgi:nitrate reductase assembly molybdenum cofactor insertion protein NarJ